MVILVVSLLHICGEVPPWNIGADLWLGCGPHKVLLVRGGEWWTLLLGVWCLRHTRLTSNELRYLILVLPSPDLGWISSVLCDLVETFLEVLQSWLRKGLWVRVVVAWYGRRCVVCFSVYARFCVVLSEHVLTCLGECCWFPLYLLLFLGPHLALDIIAWVGKECTAKSGWRVMENTACCHGSRIHLKSVRLSSLLNNVGVFDKTTGCIYGWTLLSHVSRCESLLWHWFWCHVSLVPSLS